MVPEIASAHVHTLKIMSVQMPKIVGHSLTHTPAHGGISAVVNRASHYQIVVVVIVAAAAADTIQMYLDTKQ